MVYAADLKSVAERHVGSIPTSGKTENFVTFLFRIRIERGMPRMYRAQGEVAGWVIVVAASLLVIVALYVLLFHPPTGIFRTPPIP